MYNFYKRLQQVFSMDIIRLCKFAEMFQYSLIFLILIIIAFYLLNKFYYHKASHKKEEEKETKQKTFMQHFVSLFIDTFVIVIIFFYIRKIALIVPSIPTLVYPKFKGLTTLDYIIHIALVVVLIEFLPQYKEKIEELGKFISHHYI